MPVVPAGVCTRMSTGRLKTCPTAGETAVIEPSSLTVNEAAGRVPNRTPVASARLLPVIVIVSPPVVNPLAALRPLTWGGGAANVYRSAADVAEAPAAVVTTTSTVAATSAGANAVICVGESTLNDRAAIPPNETPMTSVKFVPVIVTMSPPAVIPLLTLSAATVGNAPARVIVNWSAGERGDVPVADCTVTSTGDAGSVANAGVTAVIVPSALIVNEAAEAVPNSTPVAPARSIPEMTTDSPPLL